MKTPEDCFHLTVEIVCEIHTEAIACFGGLAGVRDQALLESAVATPQASSAATTLQSPMSPSLYC